MLVQIEHPNLIQFGFKVGEIIETIKCPDEYKEKFGDDIWVYSEKRQEPVRLLFKEYNIIKE